MNFEQLLEWQWSDYSDKHRNATSLMIHIVAVPVFWIGAMDMVSALLFRGLFAAIGGALLIGVSLFAQGKGHEMEKIAPTPFSTRVDFFRRVLAEQFVTFPRFVLSGGWLGNLRAAR